MLDLGDLLLVQLASRQVNAIKIKRDLWSQTDAINQNALIFHEAIYVLIRPVPMTIIGQSKSKGSDDCH
ncbi:MAG: hypothetical protein NTV34_07230 [Proteobacteria bacterium]|nr:hypothetical protein [Pseudomonadota bacterium]